MATNTYVALDVKTVTTAVPSITFTSIPSTYTDLVLISNISQSNGYMLGRVGSSNTIDTGSNYSRTYLLSDGGSVSSGRSTSVTEFYMMSATSTSQFAPTITHFMNYSNTTTNKTFLSRSNDGVAAVENAVFLWRSTAAINTISIIAPSGNIAVGSTFTLYGIANSNIGAPKAFGGTITQDALYTYHTFGASGTFTPTQSLSNVEALVVAGGGGGGCAGGGGGAGSLIYRSGMSLTATGYSITIGSGGAGDTTRTAAAAASGTASTFNSTSATGGGGGSSNNGNIAGGAGGSGGGAIGTGAAGTASAGTLSGGTGYVNIGGGGATNYYGGGGGGAGAAGAIGTIANGTGGAGGNGTDVYSSWLFTTGMGVGGYIAGGGGGGSGDLTTPGGLGGGGANGLGSSNGFSGVAITGGGAGGSRNASGGAGGNGGSGVVIIRYAN
jgi:hypothetical protein